MPETAGSVQYMTYTLATKHGPHRFAISGSCLFIRKSTARNRAQHG